MQRRKRDQRGRTVGRDAGLLLFGRDGLSQPGDGDWERLVEGEQQSYPAGTGLPAPWISERGVSQLCRSVTTSAQLLVLRNAGAIRRAAGVPGLVDPGIAACLGAPLIRADGRAWGALCVVDRRPRAWRSGQARALAELAGATVAVLELRALVAQAARRQAIVQPRAELLSSIEQKRQPVAMLARSEGESFSR